MSTRRSLILSSLLLAALSGVVAASAVAGPAAPNEGAAKKATAGDLDAIMRDIKGLRSHMLDDIKTLKALEQEAKQNNEKARLACIREKQERAAKLLEEVVVPEIKRVLEPGASVADRRVSRDNLSEASNNLDNVVELAKACSESKGPTGQGKTENAVDLERFVPWLDPTVTPWKPPVPPPTDDARTQITQSPMM